MERFAPKPSPLWEEDPPGRDLCSVSPPSPPARCLVLPASYSHVQHLPKAGLCLGRAHAGESDTVPALRVPRNGVESTPHPVRQLLGEGGVFTREVISQEGQGQGYPGQRLVEAGGGGAGNPWRLQPLLSSFVCGLPEALDTESWQEEEEGVPPAPSRSHKPSGYLCTHLPPASSLPPQGSN